MGWLRPCLGRGAKVRPDETRSWSRGDVGDLVICAVGGRDPASVWMVVVWTFPQWMVVGNLPGRSLRVM